MWEIAVIGDVMIDEYHYGTTRADNPESWAPILTVKNTLRNLGGAANVAANISSLLGGALLIGTLGRSNEADSHAPEADMYGELFIKLCNKAWISMHPILTPDARTIVKQRFIKSKFVYHAFRADFEDAISLDEEQKWAVIKALRDYAPRQIVISDYAKGTLDEELVKMIFALAKEMNIQIMVDTKPKNTERYKGAHVIKPNFSEFIATIWKPDLPNEDEAIAREGVKYAQMLDTNAVITRGDQWVTLVPKRGDIFHAHTEAKKLTDITGAWDTFMAAFAVALNQGKTLEEAVKYANKASGIVVGKPGTAVITPEEMAE